MSVVDQGRKTLIFCLINFFCMHNITCPGPTPIPHVEITLRSTALPAKAWELEHKLNKTALRRKARRPTWTTELSACLPEHCLPACHGIIHLFARALTMDRGAGGARGRLAAFSVEAIEAAQVLGSPKVLAALINAWLVASAYAAPPLSVDVPQYCLLDSFTITSRSTRTWPDSASLISRTTCRGGPVSMTLAEASPQGTA